MRSRWLLLATALGILGCRGSSRSSGAPGPTASAQAAVSTGPVIVVPHGRGPIKADGELDEDDWPDAARTGPFLDEQGAPSRPYADARFLWDADNLYLVLYAGDDDIHAVVKDHDGPVWTDDAFAIEIRPEGAGAPVYSIDVSAAGVVTDAKREGRGARSFAWESGITVGVDRDGTLNDRSDEDEEWVIEAALPLKSLGLAAAPGTRFSASISRCDTPRAGGARRCGSFGGRKGPSRLLELR
jgi:hypothetical protein